MFERRRTRLLGSLPRLVAVLFVVVATGCGSSTQSPTASASALPAAPTGATKTAGPGGTSGPTSPTVTTSPSLGPTATAPQPTPIVPVGDFRTTIASVNGADVAAVLAGTSRTYAALELVAADADPILNALGLQRPADPDRLVLVASPATLATDLASHRNRLGFLPAGEVGPDVRALAWAGRSLFGVGRVTSRTGWPLVAVLPGDGSSAFDPSRTWTLVAGGDMLFDRGVYRTEVLQGRGADFAFAGGTATITSRYCCSSFGWELPRTQRTGNAGAVRALVSGADLSMANLEGPAPDKATYHTSGTTFTFDQALLAGLQYAGIDAVSLANNHIGNAGRQGIVQTIAALDGLGIAHAGAGANATQANRAAFFTVDGVSVALLGFDSIAPSYAAATSTPGTAFLTTARATADIKAARAAGAQVVVVYPHWGIEYKATPTAQERTWAHAMIDAGADLVIGNHPHWAGAMEVYRGKPIWYALGNFVFDQTWSEPTEEGLILELTFSGATLVQAWLRPTIILDSAQPNLLDPAAAGSVVLTQVYTASKGILPW